MKPLIIAAVLVVVAGVVALVLVLTGGDDSSSVPDQSQAAKTSRFISLARADAPDIFEPASDKQVIGIGHQICGLFAGGGDYTGIESRIQSVGSSPFQSYVLIGLAVATFCPQYSDHIPAHSPPP